MAYPIEVGIQVSLDYNPLNGTGTWYRITDHNRSQIQINPTLIEKSKRMANGIMRRYVVTSKNVISTSWSFVPVKTEESVDGGKSAGWLSEFYNANVYRPVWIKLTNAKLNPAAVNNVPLDTSHVSSQAGGSDIFEVFITKFSTTTLKRSPVTDYASMEIEFTEI